MRPEEFDFLYRLEEKFWWFVAMRRITDAVLLRHLRFPSSVRIMDAGCGTGFNIQHYSAIDGRDVFGFDLSADAIAGVRKRGLRTVCQASVTRIPFQSSTFDLVLSFDVLCQGEESPVQDGLREMRRILRPGGSLFIRVPAYEWMRSSHDIGVDSYRRFTRAGLTEEVARAGLKVQWSSYANCFLFPAVLVRRLLKAAGIGKGSDVRPLPAPLAWIDPVFRRVLQAEAAVFRGGWTLPFGLSVICLARKPDPAVEPPA